jgi:nucleoside-diphosphate-sugar epimerase
MEKIAVVGLGWLGLPLALSLREQGYQVIGTTTSAEKIPDLEEKGLEAVLFDLNKGVDESLLPSFFAGSSCCIINVPPGKSLFQTYRNQCLELPRLFPETTKFIFTSSTGVYSDQVALALENTAVLTDYNFTSQLFLTEKALKTELKERLTVLRLAGLFGPGRNPARHLAGKTGLKNPGSPVNLVHQHDCISFISEVIRQQAWGEIFNVCASDHPSRQVFYTGMCEKNKWELPVFDADEPVRIPKIVSNEKGKQLLNFSYRYDSPFDF